MAGVIVNLLLAALFWTLLPDFAKINLQLGLFNALPFVPCSDGSNAWRTFKRGDLKALAKTGETG